MNKSKREQFKRSVQWKTDYLIPFLAKCDLCHMRGVGIEHYHLGVPVLFVCENCG